MQINAEVAQRLVGRLTWGQHADDMRILSVLIRFEHPEHIGVLRPAEVGWDEQQEVEDCQPGKQKDCWLFELLCGKGVK